MLLSTGWPKLAFLMEKKFDGTGTERSLNPKTMKSDKDRTPMVILNF